MVPFGPEAQDPAKLGLGVPWSRVQVVTQPDQLHRMRSTIFRSGAVDKHDPALALFRGPDSGEPRPHAVVGLDVEWAADFYHRAGRNASMAEWLQLATTDHVWLIDLARARATGTDGASEAEAFRLALADAIGAVLACPGLLKLGLKFESDLAVLCATPGLPSQAFHACGPLLDGEALAAAAAAAARVEGKHHGGADPVGLSNVCAELLGRPLDKVCQCSDWGARPLDRAQVVYAAQDAHALVRCYDATAGVLGGAATRALVDAESSWVTADMLAQHARATPPKRAKAAAAAEVTVQAAEELLEGLATAETSWQSYAFPQKLTPHERHRIHQAVDRLPARLATGNRLPATRLRSESLDVNMPSSQLAALRQKKRRLFVRPARSAPQVHRWPARAGRGGSGRTALTVAAAAVGVSVITAGVALMH